MNKILILDASVSDNRTMSNLFMRAGYDPVSADCIEAGKVETAKLPPGAVIVTAMRLPDGTAREFIDWLNAEGYKFPVIAIVENLNALDIVNVMSGDGATDIVQPAAIDKQLIETVKKYARPEMSVLTLDNQLLPRKSEVWQKIEEKIKAIAATNANAIIFGERGSGKEQVAHQIYLNSSREQKPHTVIEAGSVAFIGLHDPASERSELYNRIKSYFHKAAGGTIILKNVHLLSFEKQSVLLHILETEYPDVPWPGNVRELKDIVPFAAFHAKGDTISEADINFNLSDTSILSELHLKNEDAKKQRIINALKRTDWNKTQAAKLLNISRPTLDYSAVLFWARWSQFVG